MQFMNVKVKDNKTYLYLSIQEWKELIEATPAIERVTWAKLSIEGYDNLILDYPRNHFIAVLKRQSDPTPL